MKEVLILGNSIRRKQSETESFIQNFPGEIWVCNGGMKEPYSQISLVGTVHIEVAEKAIEYKKENNKEFEILCSKELEGCNLFQNYRGWSTGSELIQEAYTRGYDKIYLGGWDFQNGRDVYQPHILVVSNFEKQYWQIIEENPKINLEVIGNDLLKNQTDAALGRINASTVPESYMNRKRKRRLERLAIMNGEIEKEQSSIFAPQDRIFNDKIFNEKISEKKEKNKNKKILLFSSLNKNFIPLFKTFLHSLLHHNYWLDIPYRIMDFDLDKNDREGLLKIYPRLEFVKPKYKNYTSLGEEKTPQHFIQNYYKLDIYSYTDFDTVIAIDVDMLVVGDVSEVIYSEVDLGAVPQYSQGQDKIHENSINGGLVVVGKKYLNLETYKECLNTIGDGHPLAEQDVFNIVFKEKWTPLNKIYNVEKRMIYSKKFRELFLDTRILHFVAEKPNNPSPQERVEFSNLINLWQEYTERFCKDLEPVKRVLVLGRAPCVLDYEFGELINTKFDKVIRINNYEIQGFERFAGTKTDYIFTTFATKPSKPISQMDEKNIYMFVAERQDFGWLQDRVNKGTGLNLKKINILPEFYYTKFNEELGLTGKERSCSGLIAIKWALNNYPDSEIWVHGINGFKNVEKELLHYDGFVSKLDEFHNAGKEQEYLAKLKKQKKIKFLRECYGEL